MTGTCVATTFQASGGLSGVIRLRAGVGEAGIPLSPAALVLPRFTDLLPKSLVDGDVRLLGLAYSLATAPAGAAPAGLPHPLKADVERRAIDLGEAGQRLYLQEQAPRVARGARARPAREPKRPSGIRRPAPRPRPRSPGVDRARGPLPPGAAEPEPDGGRFRRPLRGDDELRPSVAGGRAGPERLPAGARSRGPAGLRRGPNGSRGDERGRRRASARFRTARSTRSTTCRAATKMPFAVVGRLDPATSYRVDLRAPATGATGRLVLVVPSDDLSGFRKVDFGSRHDGRERGLGGRGRQGDGRRGR